MLSQNKLYNIKDGDTEYKNCIFIHEEFISNKLWMFFVKDDSKKELHINPSYISSIEEVEINNKKIVNLNRKFSLSLKKNSIIRARIKNNA